MDRIVDIATDGQHLSAYRGFMVVGREREEVGRVALDDIAAVIVHAHGVTYSNNLLVALAERGATLVLCGSNHAPVALCAPIAGHHAQGARMRAQWDAPRPLAKQLWRQLVVSKIRMQAAVLAATGQPHSAFDFLARRVRSGDPENVEAQAARRYWPLLFGPGFRRDRDAEGVNALLNYGYTIMRSVLARAVVASGLHPTIGLFHRNRSNAFALADDLIEPFRPIVDCLVYRLAAHGHAEVTPEVKHALARVIAFDLRGDAGTSPVSVMALRLAQSLARSFEERRAALALPDPPSPLDLAGLGAAPADVDADAA